MEPDLAELIQAATSARACAYAPYSGYPVGAAVLDEFGSAHGGCNVENASYGLTLCAERSAVARLIASGARRVKACAVATADGGTPCGMCLQTLLEFAEDPKLTRIACVSEDGSVKLYSLADLMPHGFTSDRIRRTESAP